jgi:hypothetical protein
MRFLRLALLFFGGLFLFLATVLLWLDLAIFDSGRFARAVSDTLAEPKVQQRLATVISQQAAEEIDVKSRVQANVPENLQFVTKFLSDDVEQSVIYRVTLRLLSSEFTEELSQTVVERLHVRLMNVLEDKGAVKAENDQLVLDLRPVVERVFERLGLDVPQRLQEAGAQGSGVIVLVEDTKYLQMASVLVSNRNIFLVLMLLASVGCFAGFVWTGTDRVHEVSNTGFAVAATGIVTLLIVFIANQFIPSERVALEALIRNLEGDLRRLCIFLIIIGAAIVATTDLGIRASIHSGYVRVLAASRAIGTGLSLLVATVVAGFVLLLLS